MKNRNKLLAALVGSIVAADALLKQQLHTPLWAEHHRSNQWALTATLGLLFPLVLFLYSRLQLAAALLLAGAIGNTLSAYHGAVPNPFVAGQYAFNAADISLAVGALFFVIALPYLIRDIALRKNRSYQP